MKQYVCNKAEKCEAYWCIHNGSHSRREDGEKDFYGWNLSCTQRRLSNRGCRELGIYDEVKCIPAKGVRAKKFPENHEYGSCTYIDWDTGECCNGVEEGTKCRGLYKEKCGGYEEYDFGFNFIELVGKEITEAELEQKKIEDLIYALSCGCEDMGWDDKRRYCEGLHPSCCKDCTKSKANVTARIMGQMKK